MIIDIEEDQRHFAFYLQMLQVLHIDFLEFFIAVARTQHYEQMIIEWIENLYQQGATVEECKKIIYQKRHHYFFTRDE
ncbi:hypothetical protein [Aquimarina sp. MMG016]|uniref:hypothetical protein n=1 Tax=Aquimarina sp. MMG016 TaxID=2822690 RepID=UPI001B39D809|nr:hypothetical protein [Aquimarina sp. MMG016]MBQ4821828.1 hypothetical protein [Aquimarina sp. MMG016]